MSSSFSADTKDALAREVPDAPHCREALLTALALYGRDARGEAFVTHRNTVARLFRVLRQAQDDKGRVRDDTGRIEKVEGTRLFRAPSYRIALPERLRGWPKKPMHKCDRVMEARGALLASGSISAGAKGYHLEFVLPDSEHAERLSWTLRAVAHEPKRVIRKGRYVLYYKDFDAIADVLAVIGAHGAVLQLEDVRALKETKNRIHRLVNTEAANLERTAAAAAAARQTIEFLASAYGLQHLSPALREIAELRVEYPDESLAELGQRCNPPIGKPTANSRLGALTRLARRLHR
jgi:hypothetical protein